ncbi:glycerophosphodiester phosphodiesterase family protein [Brevibacillus choshinensis]|uniref:glycerophosphodiester phosphodiesterase family protein n=1 Tax=Brevibacillus choshinensis TaxID=54911 RepID=UPI002E2025C3|nr:glycerophosphodiester phosphodiesterase family protein [Brevibacillus choshinensis]MED4784170.1 glycerophosphodiester phosphodiesterase family protein [Brevibacillus choshinensis]
MIEKLQNQQTIIVSAHRGWKFAYPENTLLAFQRAMELGADMLEFDLRFSKDRVIMVIHDETVDRTTDGSGKVSDYTMEELKQLDAGGWFGKVYEGLKIPTLVELCELLAAYPHVLLNVEIKPSPDAKEVADAAVSILRERGILSNCVFTSFDAEVIAHLHDWYQCKTQGFPGELMSNYVDGPDGTLSKMWAVGISMKLLTPQLVQEYRERGILPWCYSPDDEQQVYYALGCGSSLMTVNNPLPAMQIRERMNQ